MATALAVTKGRAAAYDMLQVCRRAGALALASAATFVRRWLPSEWNEADGPSRRFEDQAGLPASSLGAGYGGRG
eukprot:8757470-Alexandrium_andersonii.AAC.1